MSVYTLLYLAQILLAILYSHGALAEKMMRPKIKDMKLWSDEKFLSHKLTYDHADPHLNFTLDVHQDVSDVDLHFDTRIINKLDPFYTSTFNITLNLCRILNYSTKSPVGRFVYTFIKEYGNIIESCPIPKGSYAITKFWYPEDPTTAMLPEIDFEVNFAAYHLDASKKRNLIINDHITGEFTVQDVNNLKPGIFAMLPKVG
ncbi:uncharacterized protein LOC115632910 [Scaptodrosophila lebanonensis]|uniref:Uncharacterized protein LOC115632910 n=1 Tax=Drosophila lebanonensis TaxID=7225 RepID=A0A6J2UD44_DROLE|nr:uncharacterized protein LOC115632910 [Scaptodrosophila lebanonensis]